MFSPFKKLTSLSCDFVVKPRVPLTNRLEDMLELIKAFDLKEDNSPDIHQLQVKTQLPFLQSD